MSARTSRYSARIFSRSRPVRRWRRMSRIACAWTASSLRRPSSVRADAETSRLSTPRNFSSAAFSTTTSAASRSFACAGSLLPRMIAMTRSRFASATARPRRMWARSSAFFRSNCVRRTTTARRWSRKCRKRSFSGRTRGCPSTIARKMIPNEDWSGVRARSWFRTTCATSPRLTSTTTRMPSRSDSSRIAEMPSSRFSFTRCAMSSMSRALLTWNGISVTTIDSRSPFLFFSISALPRTWRMPRPVRYASTIPCRPRMIPPVGKSGPGRTFRSAARSVFGSSRRRTAASHASARLCGGIFVAMPTAIPSEPFTRRFGNVVGRTAGSWREPS